MYLDLRACSLNCFKILIKQILHHIAYIYLEYTFCAKHMTFRSIFQTLIRYLLRMVRFKKDVIAPVSYTQ